MLDILEKSYTSETYEKGLSTAQANDKLQTHGENALACDKKSKPIKIFLGQFKDIMVLILLAATIISFFLGEMYDAITIIIIVLVNAVLGFIQEYKTEKTLLALKNMSAPSAKVYRDGNLVSISASDVVPDDIIVLEAGDRVPADAVLLHAKGLLADESILTGESTPADKLVGAHDDTDNAVGKKNIVYSGTVITKGTAEAKVIATGLNAQMGQISGMLTDIDDELTPLQKRLGELGKTVAIICLVVCVVVAGAGILRGEPVFDMLMTGITIAIAAIPEGLPATVTIVLAIAVNRMLKQKALVHKLHSVETLGCASVICTDKTGTVTENRMTVTKIYANRREYDVSGTGYRANGEITYEGSRVNPASVTSLKEIITCAVLCNNAAITPQGKVFSRDRSRISSDKQYDAVGDPTELALLVASAKGNITAESLKNEFLRIDEIPFDSESRCMTVICKEPSGTRTAYTKGSLDIILKRCSFILTENGIVQMSSSMKREITARHDAMTEKALRVLGFSKKMITESEDTEHGMIFLGLMGMIDPPRAEAKQAVRLCRDAQIRTVMITGDHKNTAAAIARQAGILHGDDLVVTGSELKVMSDNELEEIIPKVAVFARVNPSDKLRIVRAFKKKGRIVTMTGDGVNDAPAVKEASIGVSMGITGTDVTKQAADVVLLDDNFATLVKAVEQGRCIYSNIRKFVRYLLSCNIGEVLTMFLGIIMGMPMVLLPTQILLVNLVTDGLPAVALGVEPVDKENMKKPPRQAEESFFSDGLLAKIVFRGILIGLCALGSFSAINMMYHNVELARTAALFTLVMSQLMHVFECKSEKKNIFTVPYFNNPKLILAVIVSLAIVFASIYLPFLQLIFSTVPMTSQQLLIALGFAIFAPILQCFLKA